MMSSRVRRAQRLRDHALGPAAASAAFPTSLGRYEVCPSIPLSNAHRLSPTDLREEPDRNNLVRLKNLRQQQLEPSVDAWKLRPPSWLRLPAYLSAPSQPATRCPSLAHLHPQWVCA